MDREQQSTPPGATPATPPKNQVKAAKPKAAQSSAKGSGETPPATSAPDIMSRLPKSRPQRANQRRRAPVGSTTKSTAARATAASGKTAASPKTAAKRPASAARRAAAPKPSAKAPSAPARRAAASSSHGGAPGLPRLAIDGATEVVKLPLKVSGRLTLRALDAVARGLRRR